MAIIRLCGALIGWPFGFYLGAQLLQISQVSPFSNQVLVLFLLATGCAILGWLGAPYVTAAPARLLLARLNAMSVGDLAGASLGLGFGLFLGLLLAFPLSQLPEDLRHFAPLLGALLLGGTGAAVGMARHGELFGILRDLRGGRRAVAPAASRILLDTSVVIDGRIADVVKSGFVRETLVIPRFVLDELQHHADSSDPLRRERGRRGLELLGRLQKEARVKVDLVEDDPPVSGGADAKLVALARSLGLPIMSNDYGLNRVAELQGVTVLNMNDLAKAVRPVLLPGEELPVRIVQEGKEPAQGVGYLEDGTMIVVENGARHLGSEVRVTVLRVLQTVAGRMIFAQPKGEPLPTGAARRAG